MMETMVTKIYGETMKAVDPSFPTERENVLASILANLVQSGILLPWETHKYRNDFSRYDWDELLQILEESYRQRTTHPIQDQMICYKS